MLFITGVLGIVELFLFLAVGSRVYRPARFVSRVAFSFAAIGGLSVLVAEWPIENPPALSSVIAMIAVAANVVLGCYAEHWSRQTFA